MLIQSTCTSHNFCRNAVLLDDVVLISKVHSSYLHVRSCVNSRSQLAHLSQLLVAVTGVPVNVEYPAGVLPQRPARRAVAHLGARDEAQVDPVGDPGGSVSSA